jgi:type II secretory pathway pseudopilin PulG
MGVEMTPRAGGAMIWKRALGDAEDGETLLELLMTVAIIGIAFVAILGAIFTVIRVSDYHRKTTTADVILRNFAESMKQANGTYQYVPCSSAGATVSYAAYVPGTPYSNYTATITSIRYLAGYSSGQPTWTTTCPATDLGLQELTLKVSGPTTDPAVRGTESVVVIKRDARGEA